MLESESITLKQKILGILMRNARAGAGFKRIETAELLGITPSLLKDYESGRQEPDLPLLENLARICGVPVSYFWADHPSSTPDREYAYPKAITLRRKMVGLLLNKARAEADYSLEKVAEYLGDSVEQIERYERGQAGIPFSRLDALTGLFDVDLAYFLNGANDAEPEAGTQAAPVVTAADGAGYRLPADLPDDMAAFLQEPSNLLYIKLAMRLQSLSADTLRALAEGILDITY